MNKFAWHVTPTKNLDSILKEGLRANSPEEDGDLAISFFKTKDDAIRETKLWLNSKWNNIPLSIIKVDVTGLSLTETFHYELITTDIINIKNERFVSIKNLNIKKKKEFEMDKNAINKYLNKNSIEHSDVLLSFINNSDEFYSRKNTIGHITGSAFIVSDDLQNALLVLHKKYNKWVAPGGHVDDGENSLDASIRESGEEVGLNNLELLKPEIFDIDIHRIPEGVKNGISEPEHWHFDVRYLFKVPKDALVNLNELESKGYKWPLITDLKNDKDESIKRQASKAFEFIKLLSNNNTKKLKY